MRRVNQLVARPSAANPIDESAFFIPQTAVAQIAIPQKPTTADCTYDLDRMLALELDAFDKDLQASAIAAKLTRTPTALTLLIDVSPVTCGGFDAGS
jgi:hypothetical protein